MNEIKAAWEEVLIACAAPADLDEFMDTLAPYVEKYPGRRIDRDLFAYVLKRKGMRRELLVEYLEEYSYRQNRPLLLMRIADLLCDFGDGAAASTVYEIAAEAIRDDVPLKKLVEDASLGATGER